jgi:bifunctional DNase/RNase
MDLREYWDAIVRGWWLPVIFGLVGLAVGLLVASPPKGHIETHYQSTSVIGSPPTSTNGPSLLGGGLTIGQIMYYAGTDSVIAQTSKLSGLNEPLPVVRSRISLVAPSEAGNSGQGNGDENGVVNVSATGATAAQALALDNGFVNALNTYTSDQAGKNLQSQEQQTEATLATVLTDIATNNFAPGLTAQALEVQVTALQTFLASLVVQQPGSGLQVVQAPSASSTVAIITGTPTVVDNRTLRAVAGLVIGLVLGALAALALWLLDRRLKTARRAQTALGYPVVAEIPYESSDSTEAYRMLWLTVFREPLPLPPADQNERWYDGEDPVLDHGASSQPVQTGKP